MSATREQKAAVVAELQEKFSKVQGAVLADFRGMNVAQANQLRRRMREAGVEFKVVKNTLTLRAARNLQIEGLESILQGPTAIAIGYDDPVAAAKAISEFAKKNEKLQIKGGVLSGKLIDAKGVKALADLPSREQLLAQVLRGMQAPIAGLVNVLQGNLRNLVYVLEAIRKQKGEAA